MPFRLQAMVLPKVGRTKRNAVPAIQSESLWHQLCVAEWCQSLALPT